MERRNPEGDAESFDREIGPELKELGEQFGVAARRKVVLVEKQSPAGDSRLLGVAMRRIEILQPLGSESPRSSNRCSSRRRVRRKACKDGNNLDDGTFVSAAVPVSRFAIVPANLL